uniref:Uncharacterized protein n=1 Tax=Cyclophora tenuis TaxID=216820 RepID=A0A7S1GLP7_CYCTE
MERQLASLSFQEEQERLRERSVAVSLALSRLKSRSRVHVYFNALDETDKAPYVTKKQALLCQMIHQRVRNIRQHKLTWEQLKKERDISLELISEIKSETTNLEKKLMNQIMTIDAETREMEEKSCWIIEEQQRVLRQMRAADGDDDDDEEGAEVEGGEERESRVEKDSTEPDVSEHPRDDSEGQSLRNTNDDGTEECEAPTPSSSSPENKKESKIDPPDGVTSKRKAEKTRRVPVALFRQKFTMAIKSTKYFTKSKTDDVNDDNDDGDGDEEMQTKQFVDDILAD